jgi:hypothetical protein
MDGWEPSNNAAVPTCKQVEVTITNNFRLNIAYSAFITPVNLGAFKAALAGVYKTTTDKITLTVAAVGSASTATQHRRRMLFTDASLYSGMTVVRADIKRWQAISKPANDNDIINALVTTSYTVVKLADNYVEPDAGSTPHSAPESTPSSTPDSTGDSTWIVFVCVGGALLVLLVGAIVCIQHYKAMHNNIPLPIETDSGTIPISTAETVFVPISQYCDQNYHSLYADPHA